MRSTFIARFLPAAMAGSLVALGPMAFGQTDESLPVEAVESTSSNPALKPPSQPELPVVDLFEGLRTGQIAVRAEGARGGAMTVSVTNTSRTPLRVVLPPGLIASGATGQFGGFGGGGGGGFGGGLGGGGLGGGGLGGGLGGGGGTMPPMMGMMQLGMLIMQLIETDSWDMTSLMMGGMGMMGGGMMGGMGGGMMGGMGGGMMGGMGGGMGGMGMMGGGMMSIPPGFRSVPPTGVPAAALAPGQTRNLKTRTVSLSPPVAGRAVLPAEGEPLQLGDISQTEIGTDPIVQKALRQLALEKAPESVTQLVLWNLIYKLDWSTIAQLSRKWANPHELSLARQFVDRIVEPNAELTPIGPATLFVQVQGDDPMAEALEGVLVGTRTLGMNVELDAPAAPEGPALACLVRFHDAPAGSDDRDASVLIYSSDPNASRWAAVGKFSLPVAADATAEALADDLAEGIISRLVRAQVTKGKKVKGEQTYKLRIDNAAPLLLNGLALTGSDLSLESAPSMLAGFSLPPRRSMSFTISGDAVERLNLENGVKILAADLSGL